MPLVFPPKFADAAQKAKAKASKVKARAPKMLKELGKSLIEVPIPSYQFSVEIDGDTVAFFQSISGLSVQRKVEDKEEGGVNNYKHRLPGPLSYGNVTLEVGESSSDLFWKWMMEGQYKGTAQKKDVFLVQRSSNPIVAIPPFLEAKRWNLHQAFPASWKISNLSVDTTTKVVIESLEIAFDFLELT